jgi:hypothetical protein
MVTRRCKDAAAAYFDAQVELVAAARQAHNAGLIVTELHTSWLDTPSEEAVIQARVEADQEADHSEQVNDAVNMIMDTLHRNGYQPTLHIEDVEVHGPPVSVKNDALGHTQSTSTRDLSGSAGNGWSGLLIRGGHLGTRPGL